MLTAEDGQHGGEGLAFAIAQGQCVVDGGGDGIDQGLQDALAGALPEGHGLDGGLGHVLGPAEAEADERLA